MRALAFTDVQYRTDDAVAACVLADRWDAPAPLAEWSCRVSPIAPYEPGQFFKRELPCVLEVLRKAPALEAIVIDGYVWLDADGTKGLGAHLFDALQVPVIGLAKTAYRGSTFARPVSRPSSTKPLFLTCVGLDEARALEAVAQLHGPFRLPTLVKRVDALARGLVSAEAGTP
ncbi:MAG: endonuclease V [Myxococcaceae bacterium]|nr:endonuclease V [Myxococcaceae bacterium]